MVETVTGPTAASCSRLEDVETRRLTVMIRAGSTPAADFAAGCFDGRRTDDARIRRSSTALPAQFVRFGLVGVAGFVVDTAVVYLVFPLIGLWIAGLFAYAAAATATWYLNRIWTFRWADRSEPKRRQWVRFVVANLPGFVLNRGTYWLCIATIMLCARAPVLAVAAGSLAGMVANFLLSRALVFRTAPVLP